LDRSVEADTPEAWTSIVKWREYYIHSTLACYTLLVLLLQILI
ncbi:hypothetical protein BAE44_0018921, partial [Dichanthelium oligosanthes]